LKCSTFFRAILEEAGVGKEIAVGMAKAFEAEKAKLRWMLRCTGGSRC
jgi:hypothetical protein